MNFKKIKESDFEVLTRTKPTEPEYNQRCIMLKNFIEEYRIVGWSNGYEKPANYLCRLLCRGSKTKRLNCEYGLTDKHYSTLFDHAISFKDSKGMVMVHSTPYLWIPEHEKILLEEFEEFLKDTLEYEIFKKFIRISTLSHAYDFRNKMDGSCSLLIHNNRLGGGQDENS